MVRFTQHARDQMADRNISEDDVLAAIEKAEMTWPSKDDPLNRLVVTSEINGRLIRAVITPPDTSPRIAKLVITAIAPDEED
jgi:hypothetical protein